MFVRCSDKFSRRLCVEERGSLRRSGQVNRRLPVVADALQFWSEIRILSSASNVTKIAVEKLRYRLVGQAYIVAVYLGFNIFLCLVHLSAHNIR